MITTNPPVKGIIGILFCALAAGCAIPLPEGPPTVPPVVDATRHAPTPAFETVPGFKLER